MKDKDAKKLRDEIEEQFVTKEEDWRAFLEQINKSIKKFKPTIEDKDLYTYDTLCQSVLEAALLITKAMPDAVPPEMILKDIYKRLVMNKVKDAKIEVIKRNTNSN